MPVQQRAQLSSASPGVSVCVSPEPTVPSPLPAAPSHGDPKEEHILGFYGMGHPAQTLMQRKHRARPPVSYETPLWHTMGRVAAEQVPAAGDAPPATVPNVAGADAPAAPVMRRLAPREQVGVLLRHDYLHGDGNVSPPRRSHPNSQAFSMPKSPVVKAAGTLRPEPAFPHKRAGAFVQHACLQGGGVFDVM